MVTLSRIGRISGGCALGLLTASFGCGFDSPPPDSALLTRTESALTAVSYSIPLLVGQNPSDFALGSSIGLSLNDRSKVKEASSSDFAMISNLGTGVPGQNVGTTLGVQVISGTVLSRPLVFLRTNASVVGSLYQGSATPAQKQQGASISLYEQAGVAFQTDTSWTRLQVWPTTFNSPPNLEPGQQPSVVSLAPGAYHHIDVKTGRTLRLFVSGDPFTAGNYFFDSLTIEPGAGLQVDGSRGPIRVFIGTGGFTFRGTVVSGSNSPGMVFPSLTVMTKGSAVISTPFSGVVIADGSIALAGSANNHVVTHYGAFFGSSVTLFEDGIVLHYRDPYSFRDFWPRDIGFSGDRVSVTGGSIRKVGAELTDEFAQSESVTAVTAGTPDPFVTVVYNDKTLPPTNPSIEFPSGRTGPRGRIHKGVSIMGWSSSSDGGHTFSYGGRVVPPLSQGWSTVWSDPAVAKTGISDPYVFLASVAGSTAAFEGTMKVDPTTNKMVSAYDPVTQTVDVRPDLDGHCIARSTDRGLTFPTVSCNVEGHGDGTALAAGVDSSGHRQVFLSTETIPIHVWRMDGETMAITKLPTDPFLVNIPSLGSFGRQHCRMRVFGSKLYIVDFRNIQAPDPGAIVANVIDIGGPSGTWSGEVTLATGVSTRGPAQKLNTFSFDLGTDENGSPVFRTIYAKADGAFGTSLFTTECTPDLTVCQNVPGWSTAGQTGDEGGPSLRFGGRWMAGWLSDKGNGLISVAGWLVPGGSLLQHDLTTPISSCDGSFAGDEYNEIDSFGDGRIFVPYTVSGPGCRFKGDFESDHHVGGSIAGFF